MYTYAQSAAECQAQFGPHEDICTAQTQLPPASSLTDAHKIDKSQRTIIQGQPASLRLKADGSEQKARTLIVGVDITGTCLGEQGAWAFDYAIDTLLRNGDVLLVAHVILGSHSAHHADHEHQGQICRPASSARDGSYRP